MLLQLDSDEIRAIYYQMTARGATPKARNRSLRLARLHAEQTEARERNAQKAKQEFREND
jgi:hypothetical protein